MSGPFWLSDDAWAAVEPHLPQNQPGERRVDDRRAISGIIHMLKCGERWADCPAAYGASTAVYNRWNRWSRRGVWARILMALTEQGWIAETAQIDSIYIKANRCAGGAKVGREPMPLASRVVAGPPRSSRIVDVLGRPLRLILTPGNASGMKGADLLVGETAGMNRLGCDADRLRAILRSENSIP
jgi:transposase